MNFRSGKSRILISTDLIGRGIDIQHVNLVINYDLPPVSKDALSQYVHRIGRSGRFGRKGASVSLISEGDADLKTKIQHHFST